MHNGGARFRQGNVQDAEWSICKRFVLRAPAPLLLQISTTKQRVDLFVAAHKRHNDMMNDAQELKACDRHLLGLRRLAKDCGRSASFSVLTQSTFLQESLSTLSSLIRVGSNWAAMAISLFLLHFSVNSKCLHIKNLFAGSSKQYGGVAAMTHNGYGCFYHIQEDR